MQTNIECDLCGSEKSMPFLELPQVPFNLVACSECGLVYLDPRPSPEELGQYYSTNYYTNQAAQLIN